MDFEALRQSMFHRVAIGPYEYPCQVLTGSDIVLHLPVLTYYASICLHVTEFGTRDGCSTVAMLWKCKGEVHSWDIEVTSAKPMLDSLDLPCRWHFHVGDTGSPNAEIAETDFLFIDTLHTYEHVRKELACHGRKARRFIGFHDTFTCGNYDLSGPDPSAVGIMPAIREFMDKWGDYKIAYFTECNNGLLVIERIPGNRVDDSSIAR